MCALSIVKLKVKECLYFERGRKSLYMGQRKCGLYKRFCLSTCDQKLFKGLFLGKAAPIYLVKAFVLCIVFSYPLLLLSHLKLKVHWFSCHSKIQLGLADYLIYFFYFLSIIYKWLWLTIDGTFNALLLNTSTISPFFSTNTL